ncbi:serine hydrolase domain-containing protein [Chitinophaga nivalis]|uniref:Beta-lactamase family protein n=1 Tax=Chitinophaga nivalis TaxID=2991709 RepID=A0ABT3IMY5_9BACT|nr:serine hydrolase domain-containing protein [Chitinophaga nivalis]MCW3464983.1 beta-lactamase family protein [Chitinophaga nivalis]MCW3485325.1 beta-lactamase family protein [Chitinophaga nivalis]
MIRNIALATLIMLSATTCMAQTFNPARLDSLFRLLAEKDKFMGSITIAQNGHVLYSHAIGYCDIATSRQADTLTRYRIGSVSKMFTAVLVLKAIEEQKISLQQTLDKYFPQIEHARKITIENLLQHRSGIHNFTDDKAYWTYYTSPQSAAEMMAILAKEKSDFEPNSKAAYSNSNYLILSYILEKIYNQPYASILQAKIIFPLGLKSTSSGNKTNVRNNECYSYSFRDKWVKEAETDLSIPMGAGAIVSTPTDLAVFIEQLFAGKIINAQSLVLMTTLKDAYGLGIFSYPYAGHNSYGHTGGIDKFQSEVRYFPEEKISVALISNGFIYPVSDIMQCALSSCFNQPFAIPSFTSLTLDAAALAPFTGQYTSTQLPIKITVTQQGDKLFAQATGQSPLELTATATNIFQFEKAGIVLVFNADKKQMILKQGGKEWLFDRE